MKKWFLERFLPMWAKETVLKENRHLMLELHRAQEENQRLRAYIRGLREGIRIGRHRGNRQLEERIATGHTCPSQ